MSSNEVLEALSILNKVACKETREKICQDAYVHRNSKTFPEDVVKLTGKSIGSENIQQITKLLHTLASLATQCIQTGRENAEPASFNVSAEFSTVLSAAIFVWNNLSVSALVSPPKLESFSTQICTKVGDMDQTSSCHLHLTLNKGNSKNEEINVELSRTMMNTLVADLGRVRDQLSVIAGQK